MEMTLEEFIAMHSSPKMPLGEALKLSLIIFMILIVLDFVICFIVKHKEQIKELMKPIDDDCPDWADPEKWERSKIEKRKKKVNK